MVFSHRDLPKPAVFLNLSKPTGGLPLNELKLYLSTDFRDQTVSGLSLVILALINLLSLPRGTIMPVKVNNNYFLITHHYSVLDQSNAIVYFSF